MIYSLSPSSNHRYQASHSRTTGHSHDRLLPHHREERYHGDGFSKTTPGIEPSGYPRRSDSTMNVKKICTAAGALVGAAAGIFIAGPALAGAAGAIGAVMGAASGILAGSSLGGILGGHIGTLAGIKMSKKYLATAGLALGMGIGFAALGGWAGACAGPVIASAAARAAAYIASTVMAAGTGAIIGRSLAPSQHRAAA